MNAPAFCLDTKSSKKIKAVEKRTESPVHQLKKKNSSRLGGIRTVSFFSR